MIDPWMVLVSKGNGRHLPMCFELFVPSDTQTKTSSTRAQDGAE